jgi:hypothetical protein
MACLPGGSEEEKRTIRHCAVPQLFCLQCTEPRFRPRRQLHLCKHAEPGLDVVFGGEVAQERHTGALVGPHRALDDTCPICKKRGCVD